MISIASALIQCVRRTHPGWITLRGVSSVSAACSAVWMVLMIFGDSLPGAFFQFSREDCACVRARYLAPACAGFAHEHPAHANVTYFFMSSFFIVSFFIESFDMLSFDILSLDMLSFED